MNLREWALPVYTVLLQLSAGALLVLWVIGTRVYARYGHQEADRLARVPLLILFFTVCAAIFGAHFHLSRPFLSLLAVRNFSQSWLSREIAFTIAFFLILAALLFLVWFRAGRQIPKLVLGWVAVAFGLVTVYCMSRVYLLPTQIAWNSPTTVLSYFSEAFLLGAVALSVILLMDLNFSSGQDPKRTQVQNSVVAGGMIALALVAFAALVLTLFFTAEQILSLRSSVDESAQTSVKLLLDLYRPLLAARLILSILGVFWLLASIVRGFQRRQPVKELIGPAYVASTLVLVGEILGRFLFYAIHVRVGI